MWPWILLQSRVRMPKLGLNKICDKGDDWRKRGRVDSISCQMPAAACNEGCMSMWSNRRSRSQRLFERNNVVICVSASVCHLTRRCNLSLPCGRYVMPDLASSEYLNRETSPKSNPLIDRRVETKSNSIHYILVECCGPSLYVHMIVTLTERGTLTPIATIYQKYKKEFR